MGAALEGPLRPRHLLAAVGFALLACSFLVAPVPVSLYLFLGETKVQVGRLTGAGVFALGIVLGVALAVRSAQIRHRRLHEWTSLEIGG
jgi:hypothetical protein